MLQGSIAFVIGHDLEAQQVAPDEYTRAILTAGDADVDVVRPRQQVEVFEASFDTIPPIERVFSNTPAINAANFE
jgi:hypothetical protein